MAPPRLAPRIRHGGALKGRGRARPGGRCGGFRFRRARGPRRFPAGGLGAGDAVTAAPRPPAGTAPRAPSGWCRLRLGSPFRPGLRDRPPPGSVRAAFARRGGRARSSRSAAHSGGRQRPSGDAEAVPLGSPALGVCPSVCLSLAGALIPQANCLLLPASSIPAFLFPTAAVTRSVPPRPVAVLSRRSQGSALPVCVGSLPPPFPGSEPSSPAVGSARSRASGAGARGPGREGGGGRGSPCFPPGRCLMIFSVNGSGR